jgi:hypothetical protein
VAGQRPQHSHVLDILVQAAQGGTSQRFRHFDHILPFLCPEDIPQGEPVLVTSDSGKSDADSGENSGELDAGEPDAAEQDKESTAQHKVLLGPKDYKRLKHGKDVPFDAELQYLKPQLLAQALVHHKFVMDLPDSILIDEKKGRQHHVASWP